MNRALALVVTLASVIAIAAVAGRADAALAKSSAGSLTGAGSSFVFPLVSAWIPALGSAYGLNVSYSPIGSGGGIAAVTARTVDFGATDAPLSADQFTACKGCVEIPWALSATSVPTSERPIDATTTDRAAAAKSQRILQPRVGWRRGPGLQSRCVHGRENT